MHAKTEGVAPSVFALDDYGYTNTDSFFLMMVSTSSILFPDTSADLSTAASLPNYKSFLFFGKSTDDGIAFFNIRFILFPFAICAHDTQTPVRHRIIKRLRKSDY